MSYSCVNNQSQQKKRKQKQTKTKTGKRNNIKSNYKKNKKIGHHINVLKAKIQKKTKKYNFIKKLIKSNSQN